MNHKSNRKFTPISSSVRALALDQEGNVLVAMGRRLLSYDAGREAFSEVIEASDTIYSILATGEGEMWLGMGYDGIAYYDGDEWSSLTTLEGYGLSSNHFEGQSILVDNLGTYHLNILGHF